MTRRYRIAFLALALALPSTIATETIDDVAVEMGKTRLRLTSGGAELALAFRNRLGREVPALVEAQLVDSRGITVARGEKDLRIPRGEGVLDLDLSPETLWSDASLGTMSIDRIEYRVTPTSPGGRALSGVIAFDWIFEDAFDLTLAHAEFARAGDDYAATVLATRAGGGLPLEGVELRGVLRFDDDDDDEAATASGSTDRHGLARLVLPVGRATAEDTARLSVVGTRNGFTVEVEDDVWTSPEVDLLVTTDKPLYQPGQVLHMRVLMRNEARRSTSGETVHLTVLDPDNKRVFSETLTTSRFGIVSADFSIPESAPLGEYAIEAALDVENFARGMATVEIRRYELPAFSVSVEPSAPFYLPGQDAEVVVRADYLFGKPVPAGEVRVMFDGDEAPVAAGELDADGKWTARLDLEDAHESIFENREFTDVDFVAYVTDRSSRRTEPRRFSIRATRAPIHVYFIAPAVGPFEDGPLRFHLSTFTADGAPIACDLLVTTEDESNWRHRARSDRYGVAAVETPPLPSSAEDRMVITAVAKDGRRGRRLERLYFEKGPGVDVSMTKTIHRPGEAIRARLRGPESMKTVAVTVARDWGALATRVVPLRGGLGEVSFPYQEAFRGALSVTAYPITAESQGYTSLLGSHPVLYPHDRFLRIEIEPDRNDYRPGETVRLDFKVRAPGIGTAESALGIAIIDRAIEERFRTEVDFGDRRWRYDTFWSDLFDVSAIGDVSTRELERLDPYAPVSPELDRVAEALYQSQRFYPKVILGRRVPPVPREFFHRIVADGLRPLGVALDRRYADGAYPANLEELDAGLREESAPLEELSDPWGYRYRPSLEIEGSLAVLVIRSAGPDTAHETEDDISGLERRWLYFHRPGSILEQAIDRYQAREGSFVRDLTALEAAVEPEGISLDAIRDPWGRPYRFEFGIPGARYTVVARASGRDGIFGSEDDVEAWRKETKYFAADEARLKEAVLAHWRAGNPWPADEGALELLLAESGIDWRGLEDPWGRPFRAGTMVSQTGHGEVVFSTSLWSAGRDGFNLTSDDFLVARLSSEPVFSAGAEVPGRNPPPGYGLVQGTVDDESGGVLPGVVVHISGGPGEPIRVTTGESGRYSVTARPGTYAVRIELPGFHPFVVEGLVVVQGGVHEMNATLSPSGPYETVTVAGESPVVSTSSLAVSSSAGRPEQGKPPMATPRVREYFPETLVWEPELETSSNGDASLSFSLADTITTWKLSVLASTEDGRIGVEEREIAAFQPFFIDYDPPPVLTTGDAISQPVIVRNYLDVPVEVNLTLDESPSIGIEGASSVDARVPGGDLSESVFRIRARNVSEDGLSQVRAVGDEASDAISKRIRIRPDGRESARTETRLLRSAVSLPIDLPPDRLRGTERVSLSVYPNLLAHVVSGMDEILRRPNGCAEQTLSSGYPSLLLARYADAHGVSTLLDEPTRAKAKRYVEIAYDRLRGFQEPGGGFSYWGRGEPNDALTVYAVRFLDDARAIIPVDEEVRERAVRYLTNRQKDDGRWLADSWNGAGDVGSSLTLTAAAARAIAPFDEDAGRRAMAYLSNRFDEIREPYGLAAFALAALSASEPREASRALARLRDLAVRGADSVHWEHSGSTPFFGWGRPGRIETTALALQALAEGQAKGLAVEDEIVDGAVFFLLGEKDQFGVWFTTQATVRSTEALLAVLATRREAPSAGPAFTRVVMNGGDPIEVDLSGRGPRRVDLTPLLHASENLVEISGGDRGDTMLELLLEFHTAWGPASESVSENGLRLDVLFDETETRIGEPVLVRVAAERLDARGRGMLLAEIGLPPGSDVDRASLERALRRSDSGLYRYDILPDRIVAYLWPRSRASSFSFTFRPRLAMAAKSAPSTLYDYYNPDSFTVLPPVTFTVR